MPSSVTPKSPSFIQSILDSISTMTSQRESIFRLLKDDHERVDKLFSRILSEPDPVLRDDLIDQVETELSVHSDAEQKIFYTALVGEAPSRFPVLEGIEEHKIIKTLINDLKSPIKDKDEVIAKVKVLSEIVKHHVKEEESVMFSKAREVLSDEDEVEIGKRFLTQKQQLLKSM